MSDTHFPLSEEDDLPRSFRRARQERDAAQTTAPAPSPTTYRAPASLGAEPTSAVVRAIKVPFFKLVLFFFKAVFAAIPALIMLGAMLWYGGEMLKTYYPDMLQMKITIESVKPGS